MQERIARAACGMAVTLVAATKCVPPDVIAAAYDCGITDVGENRVQEYLDKRDAVKCVKWHFIGTLQRNKAKYLVGDVALIHSVNGIALAREIDRLAALRGVVQDVLAEVNVAGESSKTGASIDCAEELVSSVRELKNIRLRGIMAVPPIGADDMVYKKLRSLFEKCKGQSQAFDTLSVGMSGDYERAISFGCNTVRIGTAIFGTRN